MPHGNRDHRLFVMNVKELQLHSALTLLLLSFFLQLTLYLGKRDYVDHVQNVDPIGKSYLLDFALMYRIQF